MSDIRDAFRALRGTPIVTGIAVFSLAQEVRSHFKEIFFTIISAPSPLAR